MNPTSRLARAAIAVALMLTLVVPALAGERAMYGTVYGATSPGTMPPPNAQPLPWDAVEPLSVIDTNGTFGSTTTANAYPLAIQRWDRRDAAGNLIDVARLKAVHLKFPIGLLFDFRTENTSGQALGWWQGDYWVEVHVTRNGQGGENPGEAAGWKVGGERGLIFSDNGSSLAPFDGVLDGQGPSSARLVGGSGYYIDFTIPVGALDRTLRRTFVGTGEVVLFFEPRLRARATGIPGHWRHTAAARFGLYEVAPGRNVEVAYEYSDATPANPRHTWTSAWVPGGLTQVGSGLNPNAVLPAFPFDPARLRSVRLEAQTYLFAHTGLENLSPFDAVCGGTATMVERLAAAGANTPIHVATQGIGSAGFALGLYDGCSDFGGTSGLENLRQVSELSPTAWSSGANPPDSILAPWRQGPMLVELALQSSSAIPTPLTVGPHGETPTFAWWVLAHRDAWFRWVAEYD